MVSPVRFSNEVLEIFFSGLNYKALCRVSRASRQFREVADSERLWCRLFPRFAGVSRQNGGLKNFIRRIHPIIGMIQGQFRETRLMGECLLGNQPVYDPATNRFAISFLNHAQTFCVCPDRGRDSDLSVNAGAVFDVETKMRLYGLTIGMSSQLDCIKGMRFDPKKRKVTAVFHRAIREYDSQTGKLQTTIPLQGVSTVSEAAFTRSKVYSGCHLVDLSSKKAIHKLPWPESIYAYDKKNGWVIAYLHPHLLVYKLESSFFGEGKLKLFEKIPAVHHLMTQGRRTFEYVPELQSLVCIRQDCQGIIMVIDLPKKISRILNVGDYDVMSFIYTKPYLIVSLFCKEQGRIAMYDLATFKRVSSFPTEIVSHLQYDSEMRVLLTGSKQSIAFWDIDTGLCLHSIPNPISRWIRTLNWNPRFRTIDICWCPPDEEWQFKLIRY